MGLLPSRKHACHFVAIPVVALAFVAAVSGCRPNAVPVIKEPIEMAEVYQTARDTADNVDSPAIWHGTDGRNWLLATAKSTHRLLVHNAETGALLLTVGAEGSGEVEFRRPNGVAVLDSLVFVVERDNARVQVLSLPDFRFVTDFGQESLRLPYGIALLESAPGRIEVYVTDNYDVEDAGGTPESGSPERVHRYSVDISDGVVSVSHAGAVNASGGSLPLVVESIAIDPLNRTLILAEEEESVTGYHLFALDGTYTGISTRPGLFKSQAEGVVLYDCGTEGYWIGTDQSNERNVFWVMDRTTLEPIGAFSGKKTLNTDGIALTQRAMPGFPSGAFFAVHDDGNVSAFDWGRIAEALGIQADCGG